jgi:hypothetical protein
MKVRLGLIVLLLGGVGHVTAQSGIVFESDWSGSTGGVFNTLLQKLAVQDGAKWPIYSEYGWASGIQILSVLPALGPGGRNVLAVKQRGGGSAAAHLIKRDVVPASTDYYVRFYMRNDDTSGAGDHIVTVDPFNYGNWTFIRKYGSAAGWRVVSSSYACESPGWPLVHWGPPGLLKNGQWYRFEYHVDFVNSNHIQVHPRIYDAAGTLLFTDADFRQESYGSASWGGRNDWTLARYYAAGHSHCVSPNAMNDFSLGNNGQAGSSDTGLFWYHAAVQIRTDTWPGPVDGDALSAPPPGPIGDTIAPFVTITTPAPGTSVTGTIPIAATATDNVGVAGVQFQLDGVDLSWEEAILPYAITWATAGKPDGVYTLTAIARDAAGNKTTSEGVAVAVGSPVPIPTPTPTPIPLPPPSPTFDCVTTQDQTPQQLASGKWVIATVTTTTCTEK